jgi:hypothetical protein
MSEIGFEVGGNSLLVWKFQTKPVWQPDFRLKYLWIFLNKWAYNLKQSCSPLIGLQTCGGHFGQNPYILKDTGLQSWTN